MHSSVNIEEQVSNDKIMLLLVKMAVANEALLQHNIPTLEKVVLYICVMNVISCMLDNEQIIVDIISGMFPVVEFPLECQIYLRWS